MSKPKRDMLPDWRIKHIREKLNNPDYLNGAIDKLADGITDYLVAPPKGNEQNVLTYDD